MSDTARLDQLALERLDLLATIEKTKERLADVDALLLTELRNTPDGKHELTYAAGQGVKLVPPRRQFDKDKALQLLTPGQVTAASVSTLSVTQARKVLPGALVDLCYKLDGDWKVGNL